jgi:hypothetical protein
MSAGFPLHVSGSSQSFVSARIGGVVDPKAAVERHVAGPSSSPGSATGCPSRADRLVADTPEADWNDALRAHHAAHDEYERATTTANAQLTDEHKQRVRQLAAGLIRARKISPVVVSIHSAAICARC